jgi:hypothetical protein
MKTFRKIAPATAAVAVIAVVITLVLTLAGIGEDAGGNWPTYQGNAKHTGQVAVKPYTGSTAPTPFTVDLGTGPAGWDGVDTSPVMRKVGNDVFAYVIYDGYTAGGRVAKINVKTGATVWTTQVSPTSGFQLSTPLLVTGAAPDGSDDVLYAGVSGFTQMLGNDELQDVDPNPWTVIPTSAQQSTGVQIAPGTPVNLTQAVSLESNYSNRTALGIRLGAKVNTFPSVSVTVTVGSATPVTKNFTTDDALENGDTEVYYYYLNENIGSGITNAQITVNAQVTSGTTPVVLEYVELYQQSGSIQKISNLNAAQPSKTTLVTDITGQINTPITTYSSSTANYLYFGTYAGDNEYYQVDTANVPEPDVRIFTGAGSFYWAGAYADGNYVYFGGDGGYLYRLPMGQGFDGISGPTNTVDLSSVAQVNAGNVRSSLSSDSTYLFFTSQGGYLWRAKMSKLLLPDTDIIARPLPSTSTSTPTLSANNQYIYVGYYGTEGGVLAYPRSNLQTANPIDIATGLQVQSSPISYTDNLGEVDYIFFTVNNGENGGGYAYSLSFDGSVHGEVWKAVGQTFALQGFAETSGYIVYGDDSDTLYIFSP